MGRWPGFGSRSDDTRPAWDEPGHSAVWEDRLLKLDVPGADYIDIAIPAQSKRPIRLDPVEGSNDPLLRARMYGETGSNRVGACEPGPGERFGVGAAPQRQHSGEAS